MSGPKGIALAADERQQIADTMNAPFNFCWHFGLMFGCVVVFVVFTWAGMIGTVVIELRPEAASIPVSILCGLLGLAAAIKAYRMLSSDQQRACRIVTGTIYCAFFGVMFGGMPGSLIGNATGGKTGEIVEWLVTATVGAVIGGRYGCRCFTRAEDQLHLERKE